MSTPPDNAPIAFMKMHGLGNDFVIIDSRGRPAVTTSGLARALGDRNRGVGFDQLAEIRDEAGQLVLDFWNADGSRAEACGNATRCVADHLLGAAPGVPLSLRTPRGLLQAVRTEGGEVSVNMGAPQLDWQDIPLARDLDPLHLPLPGDPVAVGMGNPHCVFFVDDANAVDPADTGPGFETDPLFPQRTNVEFASVGADGSLRMRVWERGTGVTLACGSGACATLVAAHLRGLTGRSARMELDGGWLHLDWREDGVWMTGPTTHVFDGVLTETFLEQTR